MMGENLQVLEHTFSKYPYPNLGVLKDTHFLLTMGKKISFKLLTYIFISDSEIEVVLKSPES